MVGAAENQGEGEFRLESAMDLALRQQRRVQASAAGEWMWWRPELSYHRECDDGTNVDPTWPNIRQHRIAGQG